MTADVLIAGGGPAGLAAAIRSAQRGHHTVLYERSDGVPDKACGEGLMPAGARELRAIGAEIDDYAEFHGIRYLQEDGSSAEARFRQGTGIGIRRTVLSAALRQLAQEAGAELRRGSVLEVRSRDDYVDVITTDGPQQARLLVAADGLHSPLRRAAGLEGGPAAVPPRYGIRRHFEIEPWTDLVEVYWSPRAEAYVTPVSHSSVNVALLCSEGGRFEDLLPHFPALRERLGHAPCASEARGAGPLLQGVRRRYAHRFVLLGDAAGYVDAITGQGLSLALAASALLFSALPGDLAQDLTPGLRAYDGHVGKRWLRYAIPAHLLVALSRHPQLRRRAIRGAAAVPGAFATLLRLVA